MAKFLAIGILTDKITPADLKTIYQTKELKDMNWFQVVLLFINNQPSIL
ncbi:MAG TPA: hypothetical protein VIK14_01220 [Ignavibacteria bacterium]